VTVTLADVSLADAPAQMIARQVIAEPGQPPIPFELRYDPATIIPNHTYAVQARIEDGGACCSSARARIRNRLKTRIRQAAASGMLGDGYSAPARCL
jgi:uncharacterized lipoprotein YbaY